MKATLGGMMNLALDSTTYRFYGSAKWIVIFIMNMDDRRTVNVSGRSNAYDAEMNRHLFPVCSIEGNK